MEDVYSSVIVDKFLVIGLGYISLKGQVMVTDYIAKVIEIMITITIFFLFIFLLPRSQLQCKHIFLFILYLFWYWVSFCLE